MRAVHEERKPWERVAGEPTLWYGRFCAYRAQSSPRSSVAVYRAERERQGTGRKEKTRLGRFHAKPRETGSESGWHQGLRDLLTGIASRKEPLRESE
jgi:hypothetical protein